MSAIDLNKLNPFIPTQEKGVFIPETEDRRGGINPSLLEKYEKLIVPQDFMYKLPNALLHEESLTKNRRIGLGIAGIALAIILIAAVTFTTLAATGTLPFNIPLITPLGAEIAKIGLGGIVSLAIGATAVALLPLYLGAKTIHRARRPDAHNERASNHIKLPSYHTYPNKKRSVRNLTLDLHEGNQLYKVAPESSLDPNLNAKDINVILENLNYVRHNDNTEREIHSNKETEKLVENAVAAKGGKLVPKEATALIRHLEAYRQEYRHYLREKEREEQNSKIPLKDRFCEWFSEKMDRIKQSLGYDPEYACYSSDSD